MKTDHGSSAALCPRPALLANDTCTESGAEIRVWWIPQIPMQPFEYTVPSFEAGKLLCDALAQYDLFQLAQNIKPDYANAGGIEWRHPKATDGEWWCVDPDDEDEMADALSILARHAGDCGSTT